jgi:hypothetical protein
MFCVMCKKGKHTNDSHNLFNWRIYMDKKSNGSKNVQKKKFMEYEKKKFMEYEKKKLQS